MEMNNVKYGEWESSISIDDLSAKNISQYSLSDNIGRLFWLEKNPDNKNKAELFVRGLDNKILELTKNIKIDNNNIDIGNRINEYGGVAYKAHKETIVVSDKKTGYLIKLDLSGHYEVITQVDGCFYGDFDFIDDNNIIAIREDNRNKNSDYSTQTIVMLSLNPEDPQRNDGVDLINNVNNPTQTFYAYPRYNKTTQQIAFMSWELPNMPWDKSHIYLGNLKDNNISNVNLVSFGGKESVIQPEWSPKGELFFISDYSNYWNIYKKPSSNNNEIESISNLNMEIGGPLWNIGQKFYNFIGGQSKYIVSSVIDNGKKDTILIDAETKEKLFFKTYLDLNISCEELPIILDYNKEKVTYGILTSSNFKNSELLIIEDTRKVTDSTNNNLRILELNKEKKIIDKKDVSVTDIIGYKNNGIISYMNFYSPKNSKYENNKLSKSLPPLIVLLHGGPTAMADTSFSLNIQFWTSRGFAVADLNYRGSSGFGRDYRNQINQNWGVSDVEDAISAVQYLTSKGFVDKDKVAIRGSSAGGYSVLNALTKSDVFKAGVSKYGISDLKVLLGDTHKFEAEYLDQLIGKYDENPEIYQDRSPINHVEDITASLLILQGLDDKVVPPNQATMIVDKLVKQGNQVCYHEFQGEGHGFRMPETIKKAMELELAFYGKVFDFKPYEVNEEIEFQKNELENKIK